MIHFGETEYEKKWNKVSEHFLHEAVLTIGIVKSS